MPSIGGLTARMLPAALLLGALAACAPPAPPSPDQARLEHMYEMGCRPSDAQGYEGNMPYCGHDGGGGGNPSPGR